MGYKQEQCEFEIDQLKEKAKLASTEMEKLQKDNERLMGLREEERLQWEWNQEETEIRTKERKCIETREIEKIEEKLHDKDGV